MPRSVHTLAICIIVLLGVLGSCIPVEADAAKTAVTIYNTPGEEVLVTPQTLIMEKGKIVKDPAARSGWALFSDPAVAPGKGCLSFWYTYKQAPGIVRVTYRLKVADNTDPRPVALVQVCIWENDLKHDPNSFETPIKGTDFKAPNTYQDISFEIPKGEAGFGGWGVNTTGSTKLWCDGIDVTQVSLFTTAEILERVNMPEIPAGLVFAPHGMRVHETCGLFMAAWRVSEALQYLSAHGTPAERTQSYLSVHPQHTVLQDYPRKWSELYQYSTIMLNNVPAKAVSLTGCLMLKQYLQDGGTVILLGDTHSLAEGLWSDTALGPLLPVTLAAPSDLVRSPRPLAIRPQGDFAPELHWQAQPYTLYYHRATLRPGATLLCGSVDIPLLAEARVGKGRLVVCMMSVMGSPEAHDAGLPFWQWADWPQLLAKVVR